MPLRKNTTYSRKSTMASRAAHAKGDKLFRTYDTSGIESNGPKIPRWAFIVAAVVVVVLIVVIVLVATRGCTSASAKLDANSSAQVTVNQGESGQQVANDLESAGLIGSARAFTEKLSSLGVEQQIKPGNYTISGGQSNEDIISQLVAGPGMGKSVTIAEGSTLATIACAVHDATDGRISAETFANATADIGTYQSAYDFLQGASSLEGFLFPKTYSVTDDATADSLIRTMLDQYRIETSKLDYSYPASRGFSNYDVLKIASLVEKESDDSTRAKVAAVFINRLTNSGAPSYGYLQSDATTAYEVGHDPTPDEVHADTPYSTYTHTGLPPTPICSPGYASLDATCHPDATFLQDGYYFFYFKKDDAGQMQYYFSKTPEEHEAAIAAANA